MTKKFKSNKNKLKYFIVFLSASLIFLEFIFGGFLISFFSPFVSGGVGENVTITTYLEVGEVYPDILNMSLNNDTDITLIANSTKQVDCVAIVRDYNNDTDIVYAAAELFDTQVSNMGDSDDNNYHYSNSSCDIDYDFGSWRGINDDNYTAFVNCSFDLEYYANPAPWNCTLEINDSTDRSENSSAPGQDVLELIAIGLPDSINYGIVNSTYVSNEQISNVTNFGNVALNLSLSGYAVSEGDDYAMNCTLGDNSVFMIEYEKYNLTSSTLGDLSLSEFENTYINLTSSPVVNEFDLEQRQDDSTNDAINETYWRIYVPRGVAGTCSGNIIFGATKSAV
ncbi:hypothetical protein K9L16_00340 [Candidatus Pacearchaeota archaeon]|nr:hypothetical protein [Candidatus Pacearchaeota archaeon]